jgi:hypothetical protein
MRRRRIGDEANGAIGRFRVLPERLLTDIHCRLNVKPRTNQGSAKMRSAIMDHASDVQSTLDHYRTLQSIFMADETRQAVERLLAKAKVRFATVDDVARGSPFAGDESGKIHPRPAFANPSGRDGSFLV